MFICWAINHYKELRRFEDRTQSGHLRSVRAEATVKTVWEQFHQNPLWKQKINPMSWTYRPDQCHSSSGTIYTWECTGGRRDTFLLLLWRRSDRQEQSVVSSGTPRVGMKTSSSPSRSSTTATMTRFMLKHPVRRRRIFCGRREVITLPMSWFGLGGGSWIHGGNPRTCDSCSAIDS
jgi:hypothetical protein